MGTKQITTDHQACLGSQVFEELAIINSAWGPDLYDMAAWNAAHVEEISLLDFEELIIEDADCLAWDKGLAGYGLDFTL